MSDILPVFIGYDPREDLAAEVCRKSMTRRTSKPLHIQYLKEPALRHNGWYDRPWTVESGQKIDTRDGKPFSTAFSFTRFLVPALMQHEGVALFVDCDFLFLKDVAALFARFDPKYAVQVVKHEHTPTETEKMDGVQQTRYWRKNWSSLILFNASHKSNMRLTPQVVNAASGQWLHSFGWLEDHEIGSLPPIWNHLAGVDEALPENVKPYAVHYTLGGPWFEQCQAVPYADLWVRELTSQRAPGAPLPSELEAA